MFQLSVNSLLISMFYFPLKTLHVYSFFNLTFVRCEITALFLFCSEIYRQLELEKKKTKVQKQVYHGPVIRYHSVTMPLLDELASDMEINVDGDGAETDR
jgi:hypothetical protein